MGSASAGTADPAVGSYVVKVNDPEEDAADVLAALVPVSAEVEKDAKDTVVPPGVE